LQNAVGATEVETNRSCGVNSMRSSQGDSEFNLAGVGSSADACLEGELPRTGMEQAIVS
jgi:hypothetical protein